MPYSDGPLQSLADGSEIQLGEKLTGWVAAHRTPIWNSDATLDLPADIARAAGVSLGSSVPLMDGDILVGTLTIYSPAGVEISLEQRVLIQSIAPLLATAISAALAHAEIVAIDGTKPHEREALYSILDSLLSNRSSWPEKESSGPAHFGASALAC